ncbi:MAG: SagB family peptide dehydrogenase [Pseudomonadota bacterium]|nr:SagB family peptide dehydrogenase [Pseudomonadota bacterium]
MVRTDGQALRHRSPSSAAQTLLQTLADMGGRAEDLIALAHTAEPTADAAPLYYLLTRLEQRAMLSYTLRQDDQSLATLEPMTTAFRLVALDATAPGYRLSRFAWLRRDGDGVLVECSLSQTRLRITDQRLAASLVRLAQPQAVDALVEALPGLTPATITGFLTLLASAQAVFPCDSQGQIPEDVDPALRQWEYHDLLFHARSRMGRHDYPVGGTFRFVDQLPHAPAIKPASGGSRFPLPKPNHTAPGPDFFAVVEARRSIRSSGDTPLNLEQLGTLLWHTARVQTHRPAHPDDPRQYEATTRPVAGGGAMHELELYLTVTRCAGLEPALYRYDPLAHQLEWISTPGPDTQALVNDAMRAAQLTTPPDVLITLAARFGRMSWKYQGMAYAAILKHVGVLYQQLYLVATALGLAPCAIGAGNADRFAAAAGTHYYEETSVGEFVLSGVLG